MVSYPESNKVDSNLPQEIPDAHLQADFISFIFNRIVSKEKILSDAGKPAEAS